LKRILQTANFVASRVQSDTAMKLEMKLSVFLYEQTVGNGKIKRVGEIKSCTCIV